MTLMRSCVETPTRIVGPVVVACAVLALTIPLSARQGADRSGGSPSQTVAIVPFTNLTEDPADDWIGAGIAESLATGLPGRYAVISRAQVSDAANEASGAGGPAATDEALEVGPPSGRAIRGQRRLPAARRGDPDHRAVGGRRHRPWSSGPRR